MNLNAAAPDLIACNFCGQLRVTRISPEQGIAVVGNGNSDVGSKTPIPGQPTVERLARHDRLSGLRLDPQAPPQRESAVKCGAMSEQSADSGRGNEQVPQKLVHLVGTRDPSTPLPWVRPRSA